MTSFYLTEDSTEERAFLQHRVGLFGLTAGICGLVLLIVRLVAWWATPTSSLERDEGIETWLLASGAAALLGAWLFCRGPARSIRAIRAIEFTSLVLASAAYIVMGHFMPAVLRPEIIVHLLLTYALVARAIYVPSTARLSLQLGLMIAVPLLGCTFSGYLEFKPEDYGKMGELLAGLSAREVAGWVTAFAATWWALTVGVTTAASRVIFGLRTEAMKGERLGQYELEAEIGSGGMGQVFRAHHEMLRRSTAIKLMRRELLAENDLLRFEREVRETARLTHPNTITVFDYGRSPAGIFYYAMELLDGHTTKEIVQATGAQPPERVVHVLRCVAGALREAHDIGLIHRDVKPANIMLCRQGGELDVPKVLDFGLVKDLGPAKSADLTEKLAITGTPRYMAPEAITDPASVDGRTDLYALGAVGFYLLTGRHLFEGGAIEVCSQQLNTPPPHPSELLDVPPPADLEAVILRCLEKEPAKRFADMGELRAALAACSIGPWTQEQAAAWWQENEAELPRRDAIDSPSGEQTVSFEAR